MLVFFYLSVFTKVTKSILTNKDSSQLVDKIANSLSLNKVIKHKYSILESPFLPHLL